MAFPQITHDGGTRQFISLRGALPAQATRVEPKEREGIDGVVYIDMGKKAETGRLVAVVDVADAADVASMVAELRGYRGQFVRVQDVDRGLDVSNVMVESSRQIGQARPIGVSRGGILSNGKFLVRWEFRVRDTNV